MIKICKMCGKGLTINRKYCSRECARQGHLVQTKIYKRSEKGKAQIKRNSYMFNPIRRGYHLKKTYGITYSRYNEMLDAQNGRCLICGRHRSEFKRSLAVDHCHKNGEVRGLLCNLCNSVLGKVDENVEVLKRMIRYIEKHNCNNVIIPNTESQNSNNITPIPQQFQSCDNVIMNS